MRNIKVTKLNNALCHNSFTLKQGDAYYIKFSFEDEDTSNRIITPDTIKDLSISIGGFIKKYSENTILYEPEEHVWLYRLTQYDSYNMKPGMQRVEAFILYSDDEVVGINLQPIFVQDTDAVVIFDSEDRPPVYPTGTMYINTVLPVDVYKYAYAQVQDDNLVPENILEGVSVLGVEGTLRYAENAYDNILYIDEYLYKVEYSDLDYEYAYEHMNLIPVDEDSIGACSSIKMGTVYARNFDWLYSDTVEFVVHSTATLHRHEVWGVTRQLPELNKDFVRAKAYSRIYKLLPFVLVDGINDSGLIVSSNVVPTDKGETTGTTPTLELYDTVSNRMLPRYLLDRCDTAQEAVELIQLHLSIHNDPELIDLHYDLHFMIADSTNTYIVEFVENAVNVIDAHVRPYMTNFFISGVTLKSQEDTMGVVYTPHTLTETQDAVSYNHVTENGSGLERYNLLSSSYFSYSNMDYFDESDRPTDMESAINAIERVRYSKAYQEDNDPYWYTEFVNDTFKVNTPELEYLDANIKEIAQLHWDDRDRLNPNVWHTSHRSIYDLTNNELRVYPQELPYYFLFNHKEPLVWEKGQGVDSAQTTNTGARAKGDYSVAEGELTEVTKSDNFVEWYNDGRGAHAEGGGTTAVGAYSHAEGNSTITNNAYEHAEGHFNVSNFAQANYPNAGNTIHSIGIGSNLQNRKNAFEVMQTGDAYLYGVGGYDGTNYDEAETLQEVLSKPGLPVVEGSGKALVSINGEWTEQEGYGYKTSGDITVYQSSISASELSELGSTWTYSEEIDEVPVDLSDMSNIIINGIELSFTYQVLGDDIHQFSCSGVRIMFDTTSAGEGKWAVIVMISKDFYPIKPDIDIQMNIEGEDEVHQIDSKYIPKETEITEDSTDEEIPTSKAVVDYVEDHTHYTYVYKQADEPEEAELGDIWVYMPDYLKFTAEEAGSTFGIAYYNENETDLPTIKYSLDSGSTWSILEEGTNVTLLNVGDSALLKGDGKPLGNENEDHTEFVMSGLIAASGDISTLGPMAPYGYMELFDECESLTVAPRLSAVVMEDSCYLDMFYGCINLVTPPELPATTLADWCYYDMFCDCTSLVSTPNFPATELSKGCYSWMFDGCTSLTEISELPSVVLADDCYKSMFANCTSLVNVPTLPATTLTSGCYSSMFYNCTSLVNPPELHATALANSCYSLMFSGCTSIVEAPALPATVLKENCYNNMFNGCTSLTEAPELPATEIDIFCCYDSMFYDCTSLNHISVNFSNWDSGVNTSMWVYNVSATGTFECPYELPSTTGYSYIPVGWTVVKPEPPIVTYNVVCDDIYNARTISSTSYTAHVGDAVTINAPVLAGYVLQYPQTVSLVITLDLQQAVFNYEPRTYKIVCLSNGSPIAQDAIVHTTESIVSVYAPTFEGYTLISNEPITLDMSLDNPTAIFLYAAALKAYKITCLDMSYQPIQEFTDYTSDATVTVYAPTVPGYSLMYPSEITLDMTESSPNAVFFYQLL